MERPLDEGDVAELLGELRGRRVALEPPAVPGQHHEGKIRPGRLRGDPAHELPGIRAVGGLLGENREVRTRLYLPHQMLQIGADLGMEAGIAQYAGGDDRIATVRRQNQSFRRRRIAQAGSSINGSRFPI